MCRKYFCLKHRSLEYHDCKNAHYHIF
ncbi:AN1-type zinc finger domain-containing protein [Methanomethylovorans sp.]